MVEPKTKARAMTALFIVLAVIGWCGMMSLYLAIHNLVEQNAVPVSLPFKEFNARSWEQGYFTATGSFENQSAIVPGDELPPQANTVRCDKDTKTCTVTNAQVWEHTLSLDTSAFDIGSWTDQQITFADDSPICVTNAYVIDRAAQTITLLVRTRAVIPDYAAKSDLHPCDNIKNANIDLADGFKVYWRARTDYEASTGFYFHAALVVANVLFFAAIGWLWRRRAKAVAVSPIELAIS